MTDQIEFSAALLNPEVDAPKNLISPDGSPAGSRFDVYRNNVTLSLLDAMKLSFPVIEKLLGTIRFRDLALAYIRQHPPQSPVLMFFGADFDRFIENYSELSHIPYLPDIARLELAQRECYHAEDAELFDASNLQELGEDAVMAGYLRPAPATRIIKSKFPIYDIWLRNSGEDDHPISKESQHVLLTRPVLDVECTQLTPAFSKFLNLLSQHTVGNAIQQTLETEIDFPLGEILTIILKSGFAQINMEKIL